MRIGGVDTPQLAVDRGRAQADPKREPSAVPNHALHKRARREAFEWYLGAPPSPDEARRHFVEKARRDPRNLLLYEEALRIFIGTCWKFK
jgi:hypothetical protein